MQTTADHSIADILRTHAQRSTDKSAILAPEKASLSYGELWSRAGTLGTALASHGIEIGDRVAIVLENGPDVAAISVGIACWTAIAPLNPGYTRHEFERYMSHLKIRLLVTHGGAVNPARQAARALGLPILVLQETDRQTVAQLDCDDVAPITHQPSGKNDDALILHTSGTTGQPKIVPLTQANLLASIANMSNWFALTPKDRCLNIMPSFHIHGIMAGLFVPLISGGSTVCPKGLDPDAFFDWLAEFGPSWYSAVPTMHQTILSRGSFHDDSLQNHKLRFIRSSSAPLPTGVLRNLENSFGVPVLEALSMTEACHQVCCNPLPPGECRPGTVGLPAGIEVAILSDSGDELEAGKIGEVAAKGANLLAGYEENPEANRQSFVNGWFRTGDQGYFDEAGYLCLTGRLKELINRGGEKIAPLEIDRCLLEHPAVAGALCCPIAHPSLGEEVSAAVVLNDKMESTERDLQEHVRVHLAAYKVPRKIVFLETLPKGATGKPDRNALRQQIEASLKTQGIDASSPQVSGTPLEEKVRDIWGQALEREDIGPDDDFFLLGGDSLQAVRLQFELENAFDVTLPTDAIFSAGATTARMAELIAGLQKKPHVSRIGDAGPIDRDAAIPASAGQQSLWFLSFLSRGLPIFNTATALRIRGPLDTEALAGAITVIERRHEALRTTLRLTDGILHQTINKPGTLTLIRDRLAPGTGLDDALRECVERPFDYDGGPLVRADLITTADDDHILIMTLHHLISDGWARDLLRDEIAALYVDLSAGRPPPKQGDELQFADFVLWQQRRFEAGEYRDDIDYWSAQLEDAPPPFRLPTDHEPPEEPICHSATYSMQLTPPQTALLRDVARQNRTTLFTVLFAVFAALLDRLTDRDELVLHSFFANRIEPRTENIIGSLFNQIPLRISLSGAPDFQTLLARARRTVTDAFAHQAVPMEYVYAAQQQFARHDRGQVLPVSFQLQNYQSPAASRMVQAGIAPYSFDIGILPSELSVEWRTTDGTLHCDFAYQTALFNHASIAEMADIYRQMLEDAGWAPETRIDRLGL